MLNPLWNVYQTSDEQWLQLAMLEPAIYWKDFCTAIDRTDLILDIRFRDAEVWSTHCRDLVIILDEVFVSNPIAYWKDRLKKHNCIFDPVASPEQVIEDPQAIASNFFETIAHPTTQKAKFVTAPVKFCQNPSQIQGPSPNTGQHSEEVLLKLGYTHKEILKLRSEATIN